MISKLTPNPKKCCIKTTYKPSIFVFVVEFWYHHIEISANEHFKKNVIAMATNNSSTVKKNFGAVTIPSKSTKPINILIGTIGSISAEVVICHHPFWTWTQQPGGLG